MKATKTWSFAGLLLLAGMSSVSCGKDEGTGGHGGNGSVITGGTGGTSGGVGNGGTRTDGGTAGTGMTPTSATKLGRACVAKADCADPNAPNLTCITSKDAVLGDGAPPKGLCTQECDLPTQDSPDDPCLALGAGAVCYPFSTDPNSTTGYCVEGCAFGTPDIGEAKCHSRQEFACNPALLGPTNTACTTTDDCQGGELCVQGVCNIILPACLPSCRGDIDCDAGTYCDQAFLNGVCVTTKQTGKTLGEPCNVNAATEPDEPDECLGFCRADDVDSPTGHCATSCTLGAACAWNAGTEKFDGACLYLSAITGDNTDVGDFGFCTPTCNCAAECQDATLGCEVSPAGALPDQYRGGGLCFPPDPTTSKPYDQCGAGGSPDPGAGGAPTGTGGAP